MLKCGSGMLVLVEIGMVDFGRDERDLEYRWTLIGERRNRRVMVFNMD